MKINENELVNIYVIARKESDNFQNIPQMLETYQKSLLRLRLALAESREKFAKNCKIDRKSIKLIEEGSERLGEVRIKRIIQHLSQRCPIFDVKNILSTFRLFSSMATYGFFKICKQQISKRARQIAATKMLKSIKMTETERQIYTLLFNSGIQFVRGATLLIPEDMNLSMVTVDFAIPSEEKPILLIEVTGGKIIYKKDFYLLNILGTKKLILGYRIKKYLPTVKTILYVHNELDAATKAILSEAYDYVFTEGEIDQMFGEIRNVSNHKIKS